MSDVKDTFQFMTGEEKPAIPEMYISEQTTRLTNNDNWPGSGVLLSKEKELGI